MTTHNLVPMNRMPVYYLPAYRPVPQLYPVEIDDNYFDKLAAFGLACLIAAIVGKLVMTSVYR